MQAVKWIKLDVNLFEDRRIKYLRRMPDGDTYILIWIMMQTLAGKCNSDGALYITEDIPYTAESLSWELGIDESVLSDALKCFRQLSLVEMTDEGYIAVCDWATEQNVEALRDMREYFRDAKRKSRSKDVKSDNVKDNVKDMSKTSQKNVKDMSKTNKTIDKDIEKEREVEGEEKREMEEKEICDRVKDAFAECSPSFKAPEYFSDKLKRACGEAYRLYGYDTLSKCFARAEESEFLKGGNEREWVATFDWIIDKDNIAKILNGNYDSSKAVNDGSGGLCSSFSSDEFIAAALARGFVD